MSRALSDLIAYTQREAAIVGNVRRLHIAAAVRDLSLSTHKVGSRTLILRRDLEAWIESHPPAPRKSKSTIGDEL